MEEGTLYIIATPIGNLSDITLRAIETLKEKSDYIYCEDTRQTKKLMQHLNINTGTEAGSTGPLLRSLHAHSSEKKIEEIIGFLKNGKSVSYVTDSGTPGLSDPGSVLVKIARNKGIKVEPVPGPSALSTIISVSGFPSKNIFFAGFLSKKEGKKKKELEKLKGIESVIVVFESPYRIKKLIKLIYELFPDSEIVIGREITKIYEEFICGKIEDVYKNTDKIKEKGEFTVAIYNA